MRFVTETRIIVKAHFTVESDNSSVRGLDKWVYFDESGVFTLVYTPQFLKYRNDFCS